MTQESSKPKSEDTERGAVTAFVASFLEGHQAILLAILSLALGLAAVLLTPREEEPQIVVPIADILVSVPGASAYEVEKQVATPLERYLWQIDGVEHVYSVSRRGQAVVTVRFYVGQDRERSLVKLNNRLGSVFDQAPPGVTNWLVKPIEIDDVPIVTLTLSSEFYDDLALRRMAEELRAHLDSLREISRTRIHGGIRREIRVEIDPDAMGARGVTLLEAATALGAGDFTLEAGGFDRANRRIELSAGPALTTVQEVEGLVVAVSDGRTVHIRDIGNVVDGAEDAISYTRIGFGPAAGLGPTESLPRSAVTLAISKQKGSNAVAVAKRILDLTEELRRDVLPTDVRIDITRDYGSTANAKVDELLFSLAFAMASVIVLLVLSLGWRAGLVVALAVPMSFSLALFVNLVFGFTINRVTLFALILTLGIVVDDPITLVENVQRHLGNRGARSIRDTVLDAVQEILPPIFMSTLTIVVSFLPMFFITGMMGPYMGPMAITVPLTVSFSTLAALTVVPWMAYLLLRSMKSSDKVEAKPASLLARLYRRTLGSLLDSRWRRGLLYGSVVGLLGLAGLLVVLRAVPLKMLPFDNKSELQLVIDLPEGTTLETTDAIVRNFETYLSTIPEVVDFESYVGTFSPIDFNGMVRRYYFRQGPNVADIRINLASKDVRVHQSHEIGLRIRDDLMALAERHEVALKIVESPPGPPVLATLVGEIYGGPDHDVAELDALGHEVLEIMADEPGLVDLDHLAEEPRTRLEFMVDKEKAGLHGIASQSVAETLAASAGVSPATLHGGEERTPLHVALRLPRAARSGPEELARLQVRGKDGELIPIGELGSFVEVEEDEVIYHKNLRRVSFVTAEVAGRAPGEAILDLQSKLSEKQTSQGMGVRWSGEGEWEITLRVFRDLGLAFGAAMLGIYLLLILQTGSFLMPLVIMSAIPLTAIGIMPGFFLLNLFFGNPIGNYSNPVFFTATAMIGMIALGGIVVRNSIVLIEFIQDAVAQGSELREAIVESGAARMRPILLTALTTATGAVPITFDPVFSGLAWSLIFGLFASTAFTLVLVPVLYSQIYVEK